MLQKSWPEDIIERKRLPSRLANNYYSQIKSQIRLGHLDYKLQEHLSIFYNQLHYHIFDFSRFVVLVPSRNSNSHSRRPKNCSAWILFAFFVRLMITAHVSFCLSDIDSK